MWKKLLKWFAGPVLKAAQPAMAKWIDSQKDELIKTLQEADGATLAKQICDKIKESL